MLRDVTLNAYQLDAVEKMKNGCILVGDVGSGKSRTALAYYFMKVCKSELKINGVGKQTAMKEPRNLYIITTAKKRDSGEWLDELLPFCIMPSGPVTIMIDSWNNIKKYKDVYGAFFIFDEQRLVGSGAWVKAFYNIARKNQWVLLSATPGDTWTDYIPVFVANGFYKNKTQFQKEHCLYSPFITKYPKLEGYQKEGILLKHKMDISIPLPVDRHTSPHHIRFMLPYDKELYRKVWRDRWDPWEDEPIQETGKLMYLLRKVTNDDERRLDKVSEILKSHQRAIIFYNFSYELHKLRELCIREGYDIGEWNGEVHSSVPDTERWVYLVQYTAGCEGWNCITCNCMIFYSQSYSYRMTKQAEGRIDRMNTPFTDLYYYHLKSSAPVDLAISRALSQKKDFNERSFFEEGKKLTLRSVMLYSSLVLYFKLRRYSMKCERCGEEFDAEENERLFLGELRVDGKEDKFDEYYNPELCYYCNRDDYYEDMKARHELFPDERERFNEIWGWAVED